MLVPVGTGTTVINDFLLAGYDGPAPRRVFVIVTVEADHTRGLGVIRVNAPLREGVWGARPFRVLEVVRVLRP